MTHIQLELLSIALLTTIACTIPGNFLILRGTALMSDAISHTVLLGIVLGFLYTNSLHSPVLYVAAVGIGIFTVLLTESLIQTRRIKQDAAIGLIFPFLFSIGIILLSKYASSIHLDTDAVLLGELAFAPFDRLILTGIDYGPISLWIMSLILCANIILVITHYRSYKITTFDEQLAYTLGYSPRLMHYTIMTLTSITIVGAFNTAGAILVIGLIIIPPATAYIFSRSLIHMIIMSCLIGITGTLSGYILASLYESSIAGSITTAQAILFLIIMLMHKYYLN